MSDVWTDQCGPLCLSYLLFRYSNFFGNMQRDRQTNGRTGTHIRMSVLTLGTGTRSVRVCGMLLLPQEAVAAVGFKISIHFRCAYAHAHAHVHTHAHPSPSSRRHTHWHTHIEYYNCITVSVSLYRVGVGAIVCLCVCAYNKKHTHTQNAPKWKTTSAATTRTITTTSSSGHKLTALGRLAIYVPKMANGSRRAGSIQEQPGEPRVPAACCP